MVRSLGRAPLGVNAATTLTYEANARFEDALAERATSRGLRKTARTMGLACSFMGLTEEQANSPATVARPRRACETVGGRYVHWYFRPCDRTFGHGPQRTFPVRRTFASVATREQAREMGNGDKEPRFVTKRDECRKRQPHTLSRRQQFIRGERYSPSAVRIRVSEETPPR